MSAERDVTQEGSREQKWKSVMVGLGGSKKAILAWCHYWIIPQVCSYLYKINYKQLLRLVIEKHLSNLSSKNLPFEANVIRFSSNCHFDLTFQGNTVIV